MPPDPLLPLHSQNDWRDRDWHYILLLLGAAIGLWCLNLGGVALRDWDEGTYGIVGRELYRSGNWVYLTVHGEPFLLKPPLLEWLIGLGYQLGGIHEWTTRLFPALLTAVSVPLLYGVGRSLFSERRTALSAALVYLTLLPVVRHGRLAMHDGIAVSAFLLLILCCLNARQDRRWGIGIGIGLGLIGLSKGILVILLAAIAGLFLFLDRQLSILWHPSTSLGFIIGGTPLVGWYFAQAQRYGSVFWNVHFLSQSFDRVTQAVEGNRGPVWYYLLEILKYGWPWLIFWPAGLGFVWQYRKTSWAKLIAVGTLLYLGVISGMGTKLPWYVMPIYPFVALAIAVNLSQLEHASTRFRRYYCFALAFIACAGFIGGCVAGFFERQPVLIAIGIAVGLSLGVASQQLWASDRTYLRTLCVGLYLTLALLMVSPLWLWELNEAFPVRPVADLIRQKTPEGAEIYTSFAYNRPSLDFYSDRWVKPMNVSEELVKRWDSGAYLLLDSDVLRLLPVTPEQELGQADSFTLVHK
jgi:4-amino-4-deoxy-L-arabinose transferase-like glycosyltransferase